MRGSVPSAPEATILGKYQLIASLGHGGMADVLLAVAHGPVGFNKLQVIKRLRPSLAEEPEFLAMFLDEARLAARLNHPNVVQTNEVGEVEGTFFIAMEYLDGQPLNRILQRSQKVSGMTRPLLARIVADALLGLHHAHELTDYDGTKLHVVHRDASPHNIFVTYAGQTKVLDFGIAKAATRSQETRGGILKGKVAYMAPEQARGEDIDRRADIYAMGIVLWEVLAGSRPRKGSDVDMLEGATRHEIPDPRALDPSIPEALAAICIKATRLDAAERYATAQAMRDDLLTYLDEANEPASSEDVSHAILAMFAHKRREMQQIIERQLSGLTRANGRDSSFGLVDVRSALSADTRATEAAQSGTGTPVSRVNRDARTSLSEGRASLSGSHDGLGADATSPTLASQGSPLRLRTPLLILSAAAAATVTVFLLRGFGASGPPTAPSAGAPEQSASATSASVALTASVTTATSADVGIAKVEVRLSATPSGARMFLDDMALPSNPFSGKFKRDDQPHHVRIEADGHKPADRTISFTADVMLEISLDPVVAGAPSTKPAASGEEDPSLPTAPGKPQKKPLDPDDPWAK